MKMMIVKKFEEFINEQLWSKGIERSKNSNPRKEDGIKVKTCFGDDIFLHDDNWDYNIFLKILFDYNTNNFYHLQHISKYSQKEQKYIHNNEISYIQVINNDIVADFLVYSFVEDDLYNYSDETVDEHDYLAIINYFVSQLKLTPLYFNENENFTFEILDVFNDNDLYDKFNDNFSPIFENFEEYKKDLKFKFGNKLDVSIEDEDEPVIYTDITFDNYQIMNEIIKFTKDYFLKL